MIIYSNRTHYMKLLIVILFIFSLFISCYNKSDKTKIEHLSAEVEIEKCITETLNNGNQNFFDAIASIEKYLLSEKYLLNNEKESYQQLLFMLVQNKFSIEKDFFIEKKSDLDYILMPQTLSTIHYCFMSEIENTNSTSVNEKSFEIYKLMDQFIESGDIGNWDVINDYFNLLSKNEFQTTVYKSFIIYLICQISLQTHNIK